MNVTAILMGDPEAVRRRQPTPREAHRAIDENSKRFGPRTITWEGRRSRILNAVPVGGSIDVDTRAKVSDYMRWFRDHDRRGRSVKLNAGTWRITRVE